MKKTMGKVVALLLSTAMLFEAGGNANISAKTENFTNTANVSETVKKEEVNVNAQTINTKADANTGISIESTNSVGEIIANGLQSENAPDEDYANIIHDVIVEDSYTNTTKITVSYEAMQDAVIVVCLFDESGKKIEKTGKTQIYKEINSCAIYISNCPEYFIVKAYMVENNTYRPLSKEYVSMLYTKEMTELRESTVEDYDEEKVINLDEDDDTNFMVLNDEVITLDTSDGKNVVTKGNAEGKDYIIRNIGEDVRNLKSGDTFSVNNESEIIVACVESITVEGDVAYITNKKDLKPEEVFDYVKIENNQPVDLSSDSGLTLGEGVSFSEDNSGDIQPFAVEDSNSYKKEGTFEYEPEDMDISASLEIELEFAFTYYISWDYSYITTSFYYGVTAAVESSISTPMEPFEIFEVEVPVCMGVEVEFELSLVLEGAATLESSVNLSGKVGFSVDSILGMQNTTTAPKVTFEQKLEGEVYVGIKANVAIVLLEFVGNIGLTGEVGARATANFDLQGAAYDSLIHLCKECISGELNFEAKVSANVDILDWDDLSYNMNIFDYSHKMCDFYSSLTYGTSGWTLCPYVKNYVDIRVVSEEGYPIYKALVNNEETDSTGMCSMFMELGANVINVAKDGYEKSTGYYTIKRGFNYIQIVLKKEPEKEPTIEEPTTEETTEKPIELLGDREVVEMQMGIWDYEELVDWYAILTSDDKLWIKERATGNVRTVSDAELVLDNVKNLHVFQNQMVAVTNDNKLYGWSRPAWNRTGTLLADNVKYAEVRNDASKEYAYIDINDRLYVNWLFDEEVETGYVLDDVVDFEYSHDRVYAVTSDGTLYGWGRINGDELVLHPKVIMSNVKKVYENYGNVAAITNDNELYTWRGNVEGKNYEPIKLAEDVKDCSLFPNGSGIYFLLNSGLLYTMEFYTDYSSVDSKLILGEKKVVMTNVENIVDGENITGISIVKKYDGTFVGLKDSGTVYWTINQSSEDDIFTYGLESFSTVEDENPDFEPNETYNMYVLKSTDYTDWLWDSNILYMGQFTTDASGQMNLDYELREEWDNPEIIYVKMSKDSVADATVKFENMVSSGEKQHVMLNVTLNDKVLVEGTDFFLSGDDYFTEAGKYNVTIKGAGEYTGEVTVEYTVNDRINVQDESVELNGFQVSTVVGGMRTVYSIEPVINGLEVEERGLVYGLASYITEDDVYVGADNKYVASFAATSAGILSKKAGNSDTACSYAMTMNNNITTTSIAGLTAIYYVRAYAKLSDGSYVYSNVGKYSVYSVAQHLYDNIEMATNTAHEYLYNYILSRVDANYKKIKFPTENELVKD